jgi:hypothetical protein
MGYELIFNNLKSYFAGRVVETITCDDIGHFQLSPFWHAHFSRFTPLQHSTPGSFCVLIMSLDPGHGPL